MVGGVAFLWVYKAQKYQLLTNVTFLHKVSSLHICHQKSDERSTIYYALVIHYLSTISKLFLHVLILQ